MHVVQHPHVHLRQESAHVDGQEELDGEILEALDRCENVNRLNSQQASILFRNIRALFLHFVHRSRMRVVNCVDKICYLGANVSSTYAVGVGHWSQRWLGAYRVKFKQR
jgi:hypothetical protein